MIRRSAVLALFCVAGLAGCAADAVITAQGSAALDAYEGRGLSRAQVILMAKRAALVDAQRNLLEEYAGTFLNSETEVRNFVAEHDYVISRSGGLIKGVRRAAEQLTPDNTAIIVHVTTRRSDLEAALRR